MPASHEVAPGVYRLEDVDGTRLLCQYLVRGAGASLLVDAGLPESPERAILPALGELGALDEPVTLVLTHPDADHCGGTAALRRALPRLTVIGHAGDADLLGDPERTLEERYGACRHTDQVGPSEERLERARSRLGGAFELDRILDQEEVELDVRPSTCHVLHLPGHSPGHLAVWLPDRQVAITGDAVMGAGIAAMDGSLLFAPQYFSPERYRLSIRRLTDLGPRLLLGAHLEPLRAGAVAAFLEESEAAIARIDEAVVAALVADGSTLASICEQVHRSYGTLPAGTEHELAVTVAGTLERMVETGDAILVTAGPPRRWRPADPEAEGAA